MRLWKTTVVIWSEFDPQNVELESLAHEACRGEAYCSSVKNQYIRQAEEDEDWDNTEFFTKNER